MKTSDLIRMGLKNLSRRKARTALTVIGVVIGTISIVVMISIGIGMNTNFKKQVMELGSLTTVTISKNEWVDNQDGTGGTQVEQKLDENLIDTLKQMDHVKSVAPLLSTNLQLSVGKYQGWCQLYGIDVTDLESQGFPALTSGKYPEGINSETILFGSDIFNNFYNPMSTRYEPKVIDPSKDRVKFMINDWQYEMVPNAKIKEYVVRDYGIMEQTGSFEGYDWSAYVDINMFKRWYTEYCKSAYNSTNMKKALQKLEEYEQIKVTVDNVKNVKKVQTAIKDMGYQSSSLNSMLEPMQQTSNMMQMVLGGVGAVAMIVSAISIANTMVMSIYERTKEIGVMKVLGCIVKDIKKLFLFEAGMIGLMGGIVGIIISYITSYCINKFGGKVFSALMSVGGAFGDGGQSKFSIIPLWLPFLAAGFAMLVGIISGYYPANRATKISAIEAMKTES